MEKSASIQPAFRLLHFIVTKVQMSVDNKIEENQPDNLKISIGTGLGFSDKEPKVFSVGYEVDIDSVEGNLKVHIEATALFESKDEITDEAKQSPLLKANAPAIGFPFVRSFINTLTTNAGLPSLILPTFNFLKADK